MPPSPSFVVKTLTQRHSFFGIREFIIEDETSLMIREKSLTRQSETIIPLSTLQPNPTHSSSFSIKWLLNSLLVFALSILFTFWAHYFSLPALYLLSVICAITTLLFIYRFLLYTTRLTIFRHTDTHENYLFLWRDRPNEKQFALFITSLTRSIQSSQKTN